MIYSMLKGVDVSNHQADISWGEVAATEVRFAIIKATEGIFFTDRWFVTNWRESKAHGICRGCYHYARVGNSPANDAEHFLSVVNPAGLEPGDLVALDLEEGNGDLSGWALGWLEYVTTALGFKPFLYSYPHFMATHGLLNNAALAEYPLWYASYRADMPAPPSGWPAIAIWQNSSDGVVPGITGPCDTNWYNGDDINGLRALGKPGISAANPWWDQVGPGLAAVIRAYGDSPTGPERFVHDPDRPGENIRSYVDGVQRSYCYHHDALRVSVRSYESLTPPD